jgi:hypothetical protein
MGSQCTMHLLRKWILLGKQVEHKPMSCNYITLLEYALTEMEEEPNPKVLFKSVVGNDVLCDTFIRTLDLAEDPAIQYLMLEMIICSLELCRSSESIVFTLVHLGARRMKS